MTVDIDESGDLRRPAPPADPTLRSTSETIGEYLKTEPKDDVVTLRPIAALREVIAVSQSVAEGHGAPQERDRRSLSVDVDNALIALGDQLKTYLGSVFHDYRSQEVPQIEPFLGTAGGATRTFHATKLLLDKLKSPLAAQAAWRDLIEAVQNGRSECDGRHKALVLIEIEQALGHEWRWLGMSLSDALISGDLNAVEQLLARPPSQTAQVVWFAFAYAQIPRGHLRIGQVNRPGFRGHFGFTRGAGYGAGQEVSAGVAGAVGADGVGGAGGVA